MGDYRLLQDKLPDGLLLGLHLTHLERQVRTGTGSEGGQRHQRHLYPAGHLLRSVSPTEQGATPPYRKYPSVNYTGKTSTQRPWLPSREKRLKNQPPVMYTQFRNLLLMNIRWKSSMLHKNTKIYRSKIKII